MSDIVDRITELVDEQLAAGEPKIGYDFGDPQYPRCPHCFRSEHFLPVTERIAGMYTRGVFDADYRVDTDDSRVLCRGSGFIGPMPAEQPAWRLPDDPFNPSDWAGVIAPWRPYLPAVTGAPWLIPASQERWWRTEITVGGGTDIEQRPLDNTTTLNVGDTSVTWPSENVHTVCIFDEVHVWQETAAPAREFSSRITLDVLAETAPGIGGTWVPLTAPGVRRHPDTGPLRRTGDRPWDYTFDPQDGDRIAVQMPDGQLRTGVVTAEGNTP